MNPLLPDYASLLTKVNAREVALKVLDVRPSDNLRQICTYCKISNQPGRMVYVDTRAPDRSTVGFHMCRDLEACAYREAVQGC